VSEALFTPEELRRLDRLRLRRRRAVHGRSPGEWRGARFGAGGRFAEHRDYVAGDDLRMVDWNVYGRLGELVVKVFETEENLNLLLCVDRSRSMEGAKSRAARRIAGALGWVALGHLDYVRLAWLPAPDAAPLAVLRGRGAANSLLEALAEVPDGGATNHAHDLEQAIGATRHRGLAVMISDFYDPAGAVRGLSLLRGRGLDVAAVQVLDPADARLPDSGSYLAVDRETGEEMAIEATPDLVERIHLAWRRRVEGLERWCLSREVPCARADAARPIWGLLEELVRGTVGAGR
jgi:uncharacterized protein (DUF58 family)